MARLNRVESFRGTKKTADGTLTCGKCQDPIRKGDSYLWWANRIGRMSMKRVRCSKPECRPMPWEYQTTSPHIAAIMQAEHFASNDVAKVTVAKAPDDALQAIIDAVHNAAEGVREAAEGYGESADNMEDGFGHETSMSEELREKAEQLNDQADELESWSPTVDDEPPQRDEDQEDDDYEREVEDWLDALKDEAEQAIQDGCQTP